MAQRALRLLIIVATVGVLLMHGADASAAATHESAPVAHEHHDADGTDGGHTVHWHHVALACVAVLTAAVVIARRSRRSGAEPMALSAHAVRSRGESSPSRVLGTGPPRWLDLAVIRR